MHVWNKNEREGKIDQAKGRAKQAVGDLTGIEKMKDEGQTDEAGGKVEEAVSQLQRKTVKAIEKVRDAVKQ